MKQMFYTACVAGKSVNGSSGFQIRAVSSGMPHALCQAARGYAGYSLPEEVVPNDRTAATAPVRLALLNTPDAGRLLCHSVYLGRDPSTGRFNNFFSHLLLDVPPDLGLRRAAQSWGSAFWQRQNDSADVELEDVPEGSVGGSLDGDALARFLSDPAKGEANRQLLLFVLGNVLSGGRDRMYVVAEPEAVALCAYAVARALPPGMTADFTFSTYEYAPLLSNARLVGTWWSEDEPRDLPTTCYDEGCIGYNPRKPRPARRRAAPVYARFAVQALASAHAAALDEITAAADELGVIDPQLLETIARAQGTMPDEGVGAAGEARAREDLRMGVSHPRLGPWLLSQPDLLTRAASWMLDDPAYGQEVAGPLAVAAGPRAAELEDRVLIKAGEALRQGDINAARSALERLLPALGGGRPLNDGAWVKVMDAAGDSAVQPWEARALVLRAVGAGGPDERSEALRKRLLSWLSVRGVELSALTALRLPAEWSAVSFAAAAAREDLADSMLPLLVADPALTVRVLVRLARQPGELETAVRLFGRLLPLDPRLELIAALAAPPVSVPTDLLRGCRGAAIRGRGMQDPRPLVEKLGAALFDHLESAGEPGGADESAAVATAIANAWLDRIILPLAADSSNSLAFLETCAGKRAELSEAVRQRAKAWLLLQQFVLAPSAGRKTLGALGRAMAPLRPAEIRDRCAPLVHNGLASALVRSEEPRLALQCAVDCLGGIPGQTPVDLCGALHDLVGQTPEFHGPAGLAEAFLQCALTVVDAGVSRDERMEAVAHAALKVVIRDPEQLSRCRQRAAYWPEPAQDWLCEHLAAAPATRRQPECKAARSGASAKRVPASRVMLTASRLLIAIGVVILALIIICRLM